MLGRYGKVRYDTGYGGEESPPTYIHTLSEPLFFCVTTCILINHLFLDA